MSQPNSERLIEQWVNAKFDGKVVLSLVQRGPYLNPQLSIINGKEYQTKLGKATQVQIGLGDLRQIVQTANQIIEKMEKELPKKEETSNNQEKIPE
ncbi:MAG: hypothetical protein ACC656_09155 [Candidatus Heimdallarchaeota archaeon]